jgi:CheY-like chemotaxis protein
MCCRDINKESATNTSKTNVHLLLVDDSPVALAYLEAMFRGAGYSVDTATHGGEAFEKATRTVPNLVVTDGLMPDVDGYELIRRLKEHPETAAVPVIMLTSAGAGDPEHLGRTPKPDAIILKSMQFDPLLNEVKRLLMGRTA